MYRTAWHVCARVCVQDVDLSQYARHAAAQHESLRALQARHVIARLQQGAGGAAGGSSPDAARDACVLPHGDSPPPPVAPLLPPLEAVRAAADGAGMPPERPASAGQRSSPRVSVTHTHTHTHTARICVVLAS